MKLLCRLGKHDWLQKQHWNSMVHCYICTKCGLERVFYKGYETPTRP